MIIFLRELIAFFLLKIYSFIKTDSEGIISIYFHYPSKQLFERIIVWLSSKGYRFISVQELDYLITSRSKSRNLVFISLDDGWKSNSELIDIMEKYKVPVTIFVSTQAVLEGNFWWEYAGIKGQHKYSGIRNLRGFKLLTEEKFREKLSILKHHFKLQRSCITLAELKRISSHELITIGSHTVTHPILTRCSNEIKKYELTESKNELSKWLEKKIEYFAYPNGDFDNSIIEMAGEAGYRLCFTIRPGRINVETIKPMSVPRNAMYDRGGYLENISKVTGLWQKFLP